MTSAQGSRTERGLAEENMADFPVLKIDASWTKGSAKPSPFRFTLSFIFFIPY